MLCGDARAMQMAVRDRCSDKYYVCKVEHVRSASFIHQGDTDGNGRLSCSEIAALMEKAKRDYPQLAEHTRYFDCEDASSSHMTTEGNWLPNWLVPYLIAGPFAPRVSNHSYACYPATTRSSRSTCVTWSARTPPAANQTKGSWLPCWLQAYCIDTCSCTLASVTKLLSHGCVFQ